VTQHTIGAWRVVFLMSAGIYVFGAVFYGVFGSAAQQQWGIPSEHDSVRLALDWLDWWCRHLAHVSLISTALEGRCDETLNFGLE